MYEFTSQDINARSIYVLLFVSVFYIKLCDVPNFRATIKDASNHSIRSPEEILKVK